MLLRTYVLCNPKVCHVHNVSQLDIILSQLNLACTVRCIFIIFDQYPVLPDGTFLGRANSESHYVDYSLHYN
jgi:hypothetical protein